MTKLVGSNRYQMLRQHGYVSLVDLNHLNKATAPLKKGFEITDEAVEQLKLWITRNEISMRKRPCTIAFDEVKNLYF